MHYKLFGPFELPVEKGIIVCKRTDQRLKDFWQEVERRHKGLSQAKGCYVFSFSAGEDLRDLPCYVGQTSNQTFEKRCLNAKTALGLFRMKKRGYKNATPSIYFAANMMRKGKQFSSGSADHKRVEKILIQLAVRANPNLTNTQVKKFFEKLVVEGVVNSKGRSHSSRSFKKLLLLDENEEVVSVEG